MLKINFSYTDEFSQESTLIKTFTDDNLKFMTHFELLVEEFKSFLIGSGFSSELVDRIDIVEE